MYVETVAQLQEQIALLNHLKALAEPFAEQASLVIRLSMGSIAIAGALGISTAMVNNARIKISLLAISLLFGVCAYHLIFKTEFTYDKLEPLVSVQAYLEDRTLDEQLQDYKSYYPDGFSHAVLALKSRDILAQIEQRRDSLKIKSPDRLEKLKKELLATQPKSDISK